MVRHNPGVQGHANWQADKAHPSVTVQGCKLASVFPSCLIGGHNASERSTGWHFSDCFLRRVAKAGTLMT